MKAGVGLSQNVDDHRDVTVEATRIALDEAPTDSRPGYFLPTLLSAEASAKVEAEISSHLPAQAGSSLDSPVLRRRLRPSARRSRPLARQSRQGERPEFSAKGDKLEGKNPGIIFAFSSTLYDQKDVLVGIRSVISDVQIVGGSGAGEITSWTWWEKAKTFCNVSGWCGRLWCGYCGSGEICFGENLVILIYD